MAFLRVYFEPGIFTILSSLAFVRVYLEFGNFTSILRVWHFYEYTSSLAFLRVYFESGDFTSILRVWHSYEYILSLAFLRVYFVLGLGHTSKRWSGCTNECLRNHVSGHVDIELAPHVRSSEILRICRPPTVG